MGAMRYSAWALGVLSAALWGLAAASTWDGFDPVARTIEASAAAAAAVLAGVFLAAHLVRDQDKDALVRAMAEVTMRRGEAPTRTDLKRVV